MEVNNIYYNKKRKCYFLILDCDSERFYGRTSKMESPSYMEIVMGFNNAEGSFAFTDDINIAFSNIYNPCRDEDYSNYILAYMPTSSQIDEYRQKEEEYYNNGETKWEG